MIKLIFFITLTFLISSVKGQNACELTLANAQAEFDAGRFHAVPALLEECLQKNQNREWRQRAYLLLSETYLLLDDQAMSDESYLNVLRANPEFTTDETRDPIDLVYLSKNFTATPVFSVYGKIGLNTSFISVIHDVEIEISKQENLKEKYSMKTGWQGGLGVEYHYSPKINFAAEANYSFYSFNHTTKSLFLKGNYSLSFTDRQTWVSLPIMVKYNHFSKGLQPFGYMGLSANLLLRDRADMVIDGDRESPVFNYKYKRNTYNTELLIGAGLRYKWGLRYIFGDLRYTAGLTNIANPGNRNDVINLDWPYVDDDFRMNHLYFSIGYVHPFYKARKLKHGNTRSVLRKTKRTDEKND